MGKGRAPCCDKSSVKKGPWSPAEDFRLISYIQKHGHTNWRALPKQAGLLRCGKSCRLRWINYLRPDVKRGNFSLEEEQTIINLHKSYGNKWSKIASYLPGRTDNEIKNVWNTHIKKKLQIVSSTSDDSKAKPLNKRRSSAAPPPSQVSTSITSQEMALGESGFGDPSNPGDRPFLSDSPTSSYASNLTATVARGNADDAGSEIDKIEILFEPDIDYWELLDSLDQTREKSGNQDSEFGESIGNDYRQWLSSLENELGLNGEAEMQSVEQSPDPMTQQVLDLELGICPEWSCI